MGVYSTCAGSCSPIIHAGRMSLLLSAINPFHQRLNRESTSKAFISASQCKAHPYVFCTCASKRSAALSPVTVGGGDTLTFSMVEKSCVWRTPLDTAAEADADALGTKAWVLDAEAARRSRAERALLLPTIMLSFFWASKWLLIGRSQRICCSCSAVRRTRNENWWILTKMKMRKCEDLRRRLTDRQWKHSLNLLLLSKCEC